MKVRLDTISGFVCLDSYLASLYSPKRVNLEFSKLTPKYFPKLLNSSE